MTQSMEAKIMKYHVLSWSFEKILPEDQDRAKLLYGYTITRTSKKLVYSINESAHFYLT